MQQCLQRDLVNCQIYDCKQTMLDARGMRNAIKNLGFRFSIPITFFPNFNCRRNKNVV